MIVFVTPCSRPQNIPIMCKSIDRDFGWVIVHDHPTRELTINHDNVKQLNMSGGVYGYYQRNKAIEYLRSVNYHGFVYFLDDDNLKHPALNELLLYKLQEGGYLGAILRQEMPDGTIRKTNRNTVKLGKIDMGQVVLHTDLIDSFFIQQQASDGIFIENIYRRHKDRFYFEKKVMAYYNRIQPA